MASDYRALSTEVDSLSAIYTQGLRTLFPEKAFFPDANSTLRLTYGKVEGSSPYDGMTYLPFSTARGILQKYVCIIQNEEWTRQTLEQDKMKMLDEGESQRVVAHLVGVVMTHIAEK